MAKKAKRVKAETIDFSGVPEERRQRGRRIPEGEYRCKIVSVRKGWKNDDRSNPPYFNWQFQITEGKHKGVPLYYVTSLKPEALFNLRNLILAATGKNVAGKRKMTFDPQKLIAKTIAVTVEDEEYKKPGSKTATIRSRAVDVRPISEMEEEDEDLEDEEDESEGDEDEEEDEDEEDEGDEDEEEDEDEDLEEVDLDEL